MNACAAECDSSRNSRGEKMNDLNGLRVAILVADGFEQDELLKPRKALDEAGAQTHVVSPQDEMVRAWKLTDWGDTVKVDVRLNEVKPEQFDALLLPGGVLNPDKLRMDSRAVSFVKSFFEAGKPVAAICHGPWTVVEADEARGRTITSWPSLKTDLRNAGAHWVDQESVVDGNLVSARKPDDIPAFNKAMIELFSRAGENAPANYNRGSADNGQSTSASQQEGPALHVQHLRQMLSQVANHAREDVSKISDPKAQALFETVAEGVKGLEKALTDYQEKKEQGWRTAGSRHQ
jgi:protease I